MYIMEINLVNKQLNNIDQKENANVTTLNLSFNMIINTDNIFTPLKI